MTRADPTPLAARLADPATFATIVELVPWRGSLADPKGVPVLAAARELAADPRVSAISVTDNAGGHPMIPPATLAQEFAARGQEVIVHVACRDRSRGGLQSLAWALLSHGLRNVLAISGDYPVEGYEGLSRPVFDLDAVGLLAMYRGIGGPADAGGFTLAAAVNPFKRHERELVPQYLKLEAKVRAGAGFAISQVGYDARKQDELRRYVRHRGLDLPLVGSAYILSRTVARVFHAGSVPGCVVTDELLALAERQAASPDKGRAFFLELAAKQVAIARGLGFAGAYLSGHRDAAEVGRVLELAASFAPGDWRGFARDLRFAQPGTFYYFERDGDGGLNSDEVDRRYRASRRPRARRRARLRVPVTYRVNRAVHELVFDPAAPLFPVAGRAYAALERAHLGRPLHVLEQAAKVPLYDCRDCGDCSLPDVAYLCPESKCVKNQRNGPCGGTRDGLCEVAERPCVWALAYERLKPYGEELAMLDRPPVIQDNRLRRTSAWANTFLGRDHVARRTAAGPGERR